jgi:hypothetical protein
VKSIAPHAHHRRRTALTLLEVLFAMVLLAGLLGVVMRSWYQIDTLARREESLFQREHQDFQTVLWIQGHLSRVVEREEDPALSWGEEGLVATCIHGSHDDPRLAGVIQLHLLVEEGSLKARLLPDRQLWGELSWGEEKTLMTDVSHVSLRVFGKQGDEEGFSWHVEPMRWESPPHFAELTIHRSPYPVVIPIFFERGVL